MLPMLHFLARHVLSAPCAMIIVSGLVCCVLRLTIRTSATRCWTSKTATHSLTSSSRTSACTSPDASSGASARCDGRRVPVSYCAYAGFCARRRWCWAAALPMDPVRIAWTNAAWTSTATRIRVLGDIRHHARGRRRSRRHFSDGLVGAAPTPTLPALPACPAHNCPIAVVPMRDSRANAQWHRTAAERAAVAARGHWPTRERRDSAQVRSRASPRSGGGHWPTRERLDAVLYGTKSGLPALWRRLSRPPVADNGPRGGARSGCARHDLAAGPGLGPRRLPRGAARDAQLRASGESGLRWPPRAPPNLLRSQWSRSGL